MFTLNIFDIYACQNGIRTKKIKVGHQHFSRWEQLVLYFLFNHNYDDPYLRARVGMICNPVQTFHFSYYQNF